MRDFPVPQDSIDAGTDPSATTRGTRDDGRLLLLLVFALLVGPRVVLVSLGGSSVRVEDVVLAVGLLLVVSRWRMTKAAGYLPTGMFVLSACAVLSVVVGTITGAVEPLTGLLYGARQLEYWVIFPLVWVALREQGDEFRLRLFRVLRWVTVIQVAVACLQTAGLLTFGFSKFALDRGAGLTAGPYELGALCAALACVWFARGELAMGAVATLGVVVSSSRISLLALAVGVSVLVLGSVMSSRKRDRPAITPGRVAALLVVAAIGVGASTTLLSGVVEPIRERIVSTSLKSTWSYAGDYAAFASQPQSSAEYAELAYASIADEVDFELLGSGGDTSNLVRFYRWRVLINSTDTPIEYAVGHGPSFAGPSVDGAMLRIFIETGLIGIAAWALMFVRLLKGALPALMGVVATFLVGSIFIDVLFAMRPMILFWILVAISVSETPKAAGISRPSDRTALQKARGSL